MIANAIRFANCLTTILVVGMPGETFAQSDPVQSALARNQQQIRRNVDGLDARVDTLDDDLRQGFGKLNGRVSGLEQKINTIVESGTISPELAALIGPLADYYSTTEGNQKLKLLERLVDLACQNGRDNCELKRRLSELERRLGELENSDLEPTPTPIDSVPMPHPMEPDFVPMPPSYSWTGTIDRVTDRREELCRNAVLVARCINYPFADGDIYHGDVFRDCQGRFVFVRHSPRPRSPDVVAIW